MPETIILAIIKYSKLTLSRKEMATKAPVRPPIPMVCALIFHLNDNKERTKAELDAANMNFVIVGGAPNRCNK